MSPPLEPSSRVIAQQSTQLRLLCLVTSFTPGTAGKCDQGGWVDGFRGRWSNRSHLHGLARSCLLGRGKAQASVSRRTGSAWPSRFDGPTVWARWDAPVPIAFREPRRYSAVGTSGPDELAWTAMRLPIVPTAGLLGNATYTRLPRCCHLR